MSDPYPSDKNFFAAHPEDAEKYHRLKQYATPSLTTDIGYNIYQEKATQASAIRKKLDILIAQEKPKSIEIEEKTVRYWEQEYSSFQTKESSEKYLLGLLETIELNYQKAKQDIQNKLEMARANIHQKEKYFLNRLDAAKSLLDEKRNYKSAARIKLEMEYAEPKIYIESYKAEMNGITEWEAFSKYLTTKKKVWTTQQWKALDEKDAKAAAAAAAAAVAPSPRVAPAPVVIRKGIKKVRSAEQIEREKICKEVLNSIIEQVVALGTLSTSTALEGCNSVAASPCASLGHEVQDPQSCRA